MSLAAAPDLDVSALIERDMRRVIRDGEVHELRALGVAGSPEHYVRSGYYNNVSDLARDAASLDGKARGIYFTLNPLRPECLDRSPNRLGARRMAKDVDVLRRRWCPLDFDPVRGKGTNATDDEIALAMDRADEVWRWLRDEKNWPKPVAAFSGNGWHLLFPLDDEPGDDDVRLTLRTLSERFTGDKVVLDRSVHNPARIWKVYGTLACKGPTSIDRPYRRSCVLGPKEWS
jgi:hypothetical protein